MTERRSRRRKRESESEDEENEASEEQTEIAKHLRFNCETKSSNYKSQKVEYFKGSKAIDCLLDSKWASGKGGTEILFTDRYSVRNYLQDAAIQAKMEVAGVNLHGDSRKILPRSKIVVKKLYFPSAQDIQCNLHEIENTCSRTEHAVLNSSKSRHNSYF